MSDEYKFGIEEEYFLVDAETKSVAREMPKIVSREGQVGHRRTGHGRDAAVADRGRDRAAHQHRGRAHRAALPAPDRREHRGRARPRDPRRRHASDRDLAPLAADAGRALRRRDGRPADDRPAQHAVRPARACRTAGPRRPRRRHDAHAALSAAVHRALDVVAVLALAPDRPEGLSARRLRRAAAHRRAGAVPHAGRIRRLCRGAGEGRRDGGFELCVVGDAAFAQASDARIARAGLPARWSTTRSRSRRSIARWRGGSSAIRGRTGTSTR